MFFRGREGTRSVAPIPTAGADGCREKVEKVPLRYYTLDFIHWTREGHAMIAAALLPRVLAMLDRERPPSGDTDQQ